MLAYDFKYASGGAGKTSRLHIHASGGDQRLTWKTQQGYLSSPADVKNQELTVNARYRGVYDATRAFFTLKVRGGKHTTDGDLASCVMLTLQSVESGAATRFGKELVHPNYDYVKLTPAFDTHLVEGVWFGLKLVSYGVPNDAARVVNRLYADTDPFDPETGKPKNGWRVLSEYVDVEGASSGKLYLSSSTGADGKRRFARRRPERGLRHRQRARDRPSKRAIFAAVLAGWGEDEKGSAASKPVPKKKAPPKKNA